MAASRTFDSKRAQEAQALFGQGMGCNAIASALGVAPSTISAWAKREGLEFDRAQVSVANRAHAVDLAKARIELAEEMASAGLELLRARSEPYLVFAFGGKDNDYNEHLLDRPPVEVIRNMVTTGAVAFDKASKVVESTPVGLIGAHSLIDSLEQRVDELAGDDDDE